MNNNNLKVYFITISADSAGQQIRNFLHTHLKAVPKSMIYRILRKGEVRVNKKRVKAKYKLQNNDKVRIPPVQSSYKIKIPVFNKLEKISALNNIILYEDNDLLILNKPTGTAVHGGSGLSFGVIEGLRALRPKSNFLELVHRLDRDTSGILLIAKKRTALCALHEQLRAKEIQKDYLALVRGQWQSNVKIIKAPLLKNVLANGKRIVQVNSQGKPSETSFKVEERFTFATLVQASPATGRTNQIRVHAQYAGHPIACDNLYGDNSFDQKIKNYGLNRLFLHAYKLCFIHPTSGKTLQIKAALDETLRNCLTFLRNNKKLSLSS